MNVTILLYQQVPVLEVITNLLPVYRHAISLQLEYQNH